MTVDVGDIRKRVRRTIAEARRASAEHRAQVAAAEEDGARVLSDVVAPLFTMLAAALKSEGYRFRVLTPAGAVRLAAESSADDYIEVTLDTHARCRRHWSPAPAARGAAASWSTRRRSARRLKSAA